MKSKGLLARAVAKGVAVLLGLSLLGSCGGGTEQITPFAPTRLLVFGDEMSVLTKTPPQGRKYSVNGFAADGTTLDCFVLPIWIQILAATYLFGFPECNPTGYTAAGVILAEPGAKAGDLVAQIARARALSGAFSATDLASVLIGANDVIDLYENVYLKNPTADTATQVNQELTRRGALLGQRINELTALGPRVILSTIPLMNLTPYALRQPDVSTARSVLLQFSQSFNTAMRVNIVNNGQFIGLVELDALLNAGVNDPSRYGLNNITGAACAVALPDCTTGTLVANANAFTWLWASELWMSVTAHAYLGDFARGRALGNPF